jgi:5-methylcytosine-specific restriction endonuclease McrA
LLQRTTELKTDYITTENRRARYKKVQEEWRQSVFARDDYTCQSCGDRGGYIQAHHIIPFHHDKQERTNIDNGITLCKQCHYLLHKLYLRKESRPVLLEAVYLL